MLLGFLFASLKAEDKTAELYFHRGLKKYLNGNLDGTISDIEQALRFEKDSTKIKAFLVKVLGEKASEMFSEEKYSEALPYLERAKMLDSDNEEINRMHEVVESELSTEEYPASASRTEERKTEDRADTMGALLSRLQQQQEKLIRTYTYPNDILRQIVTKSDKEREYLFKTLDSTLREHRKSTRTFIYGIGGFLGAILLAIVVIYITLTKVTARRDRILIEQQSKILDMAHWQSRALAQGKTRLQLTRDVSKGNQVTPREMLNDPNPRIRSKGLEVIEAELIEDEEDAEVAQRLLAPFIQEKDNRVKATALKILYRYNPEEAMEEIKKMLNSDNKWMRVSAAWVLGEIPPNSETVEILFNNINDQDYHFKRRVVKSLKNVLESEKRNISNKEVKKIKKALDELQYKDRWVI